MTHGTATASALAAPADIRCLEANGRIKDLRTRIPFRFGATNLVACPHLCVELKLEVDGVETTGLAADNLPPGWFDKSKGKSYPEQLADQLKVFEWATDAVVGRRGSGFSLWRAAYEDVFAKGREAGLPDLVRSFGASLVERAIWDGIGRAKGLPFGELVRRNLFGIDWAELDPGLKGLGPDDFLPQRPLQKVWARHTVGLSDPLREEEIGDDDRVQDGLPQSLESCLGVYGNRYLKIKLCNDLERDLERLKRIGEIMREAESRSPGHRVMCSLDGNEQYGSVEELKDIADALDKDPGLRPFQGRILFIEQPLQREVALDPERVKGLDRLPYPMIIDESDATFDAFPTAVRLGYKGTSHKNCKGVIKGLVNKARNVIAADCGERILSAEDLTNIGPIALQQDLHVVATLGIDHLERNGHHYFRGLDHLTEAQIDAVLGANPGLYRRQGRLATLAIDAGAVDCRGLIAPGLGGVLPTDESWMPWREYDVHSLA